MSSALNIHKMNWTLQEIEWVQEEQAKEHERRLALKHEYPSLLEKLQETDMNWEAWWDVIVDGTPIWRGAELIKARLKELAEPETITREATCAICTLSIAMRRCHSCKFFTPHLVEVEPCLVS